MSSWLHVPMGPNLRGWLGINKELYTGDKTQDPDKLNWDEFSAFLVNHAQKTPFIDENDLVDILDELVAMDLPKAAVNLYEASTDIWSGTNFRGELSVGIAAMYLKDLSMAHEHLANAQRIIPEEPSPYINIVQILLFQNDFKSAREWIDTGLTAEPNNYSLWDQLADILQEEYGGEFGNKLLEIANEKKAWAGVCLASEIIQSADTQLKHSLLEPFYSKGERGHEFLIEYTASMGVSGNYSSIPQVLWDAEQNSTKGVPWQLYVHCAQAHIALNEKETAMKHLAKAKRDPHIPEDAIQMIQQIETDPDQFVH